MKATARGRGSNGKSRENLLKGVPSDSFVWKRDAGTGWSCLKGPMPFHRAYAEAARLEASNAAREPMHAATRSPELVGKIKIGDRLKA